jgi:thymidylate synthase
MNKLDKSYTDLLQDILDNGVTKKDRTGTGTISVFGRQIRHKMSDGFPLLTTKKIPFKTMVTELLWFLRGDTNIKYLVDNGCHIWDGDAYRNYCEQQARKLIQGCTYQEFLEKIKTDDEFAKKWGDLGPIYGKQWRSWLNLKWQATDVVDPSNSNQPMMKWNIEQIDQIANLINDLKTNPDSRRLMVSAWAVHDLPKMVLPPCHYGFQVYTRELSGEERWELLRKKVGDGIFKNWVDDIMPFGGGLSEELRIYNIPTRAISLMWNQRSVDTFLGLPFNIASYGLLLMMFADEVNMVPDELIGNLGDTHLYLNHVEQAKEQIGRELTLEERRDMVSPEMFSQIYTAGDSSTLSHSEIDLWCIPRRTREPFELPTVHVRDGIFCSSVNDVILENYKSHPVIKAPLSN